MAHLAEPLMTQGGCLLTTSYYGGERVVEHYNMMGPVKAALEGTVKYMAAELGSKGIRVNALSPGPILTRAASGLANFDTLINDAKLKSPDHAIPTIEDVGAMAAFLVSDSARHITGNVTFIDCGFHVMA
jgi:enoyl-[acyl-carrier protein] reductase I